jgi:hypothetical protein
MPKVEDECRDETRDRTVAWRLARQADMLVLVEMG